MQVYKTVWGETICTVVENMVALAHKTGDTVTAEFNGIGLKAYSNEVPESAVPRIMRSYRSDYERLMTTVK